MAQPFLIPFALSLAVATGGVAYASAPGPLDQRGSKEWREKCVKSGKNWLDCRISSWFVDPIGAQVAKITMEVSFDASKYIFEPETSGPLGVFSVGGDAPPVNPGIGIQPVQLLPEVGYNAGAPLPGSVLEYVIGPGYVSFSYTLASPVLLTESANIFRLDFRRIVPVSIDPAKSFVEYHAIGAGADFHQVSFSCTGLDALPACGSDHSAEGTTFHYAIVPEVSTWAMMIAGFGLVGAGLRARRLREEVKG